MKITITTAILVSISFIINAQECSQVYTFNVTDKTTFTTSCGDINDNSWQVSKNSCNFYSPLTSLPELPESGGRWVEINAIFTGSENLDGRDFIWVFYYVNGNAVKTSTINGVYNQGIYKLRDSVLVPNGGSYRFRIAMVSDGADEFWKLDSGNLKICLRALEGENVVVNETSDGKIQFMKERDVVRLNWTSEPAPEGNYFMIERSADGSKYEFAGYVKENKGTAHTTTYSFIDAGAFKPKTFYKIKKVTLRGEQIPVGDVVAVKF
jgi:hypothetical protein